MTTTTSLWKPTSLKEPNRSEEHTSELQPLRHVVCRLLLEKKLMMLRLHCHELYKIASPTDVKSATHRMQQLALRFLRLLGRNQLVLVFFFKNAGPTHIYPLPLPLPLPI